MLGPSGNPSLGATILEKSGRNLNIEDLVRGYEIKKNRFIEISDEDSYAWLRNGLGDIELTALC